MTFHGPSVNQDFEHLGFDKLADEILQKELRIAQIMQEVKQLLQTKLNCGRPKSIEGGNAECRKHIKSPAS